MKWEYVGTGLTLVGIGIALMLALPPPGWPKMPSPLVHIGIIFGGVLLALGIIITVFGIWGALPNPKIAALGMGFAVLAFVGFGIWFWIAPNSLSIAPPLKRLIAYNDLSLNAPWDGKSVAFHSFDLRVANVSGDTITARITSLKIDVDGTDVLVGSYPAQPIIVPQTQSANFQMFRNNGDFPISIDAQNITIEFEVDYDTIPESGIRRSYRKLLFPVNWANGKNNPPLLNSHTTITEWEK
jgi:hypothetical protein